MPPLTIASHTLPLALRAPGAAKHFSTNTQHGLRKCSKPARATVRNQRRTSIFLDSAECVEESIIQRRDVLAGLLMLSSGCHELWRPEAAGAFANPNPLGDGYQQFYGQATSASSYGGYGGSDVSELSSYKYYYDIPETWTPVSVNKQDKGYNGVDSRWLDPSVPGKTKKAYLVTFAGYAKLKPNKEEIIDDFSLADAALQDALILAEDFTFEEKMIDDQLYVDYNILGEEYNVLCRVTCYGGRIYSMFVWGSEADYTKDGDTMRRVRDSFRTLGRDAASVRADLEYYKRAT